MTENFNLALTCLKAKLILEHRNFVSTHVYINELEEFMQELLQGFLPKESGQVIIELQDLQVKAKDRNDSFFNNVPVGCCYLDKDGVIVTANKAFSHLLRLGDGFADGHDMRNYIHRGSIDLFNFQINKIFASKTTLSTNLRIFKEEKELYIRFQAAYYREKDTDFLQCTATDITDLKAIENELAVSEEQFRNLIAEKERSEQSGYLRSARLAYSGQDMEDMRISLKTILNFAHLLNEPELDAEKRSQFTEAIITQTSNLIQISNILPGNSL